MSHFLYYYGNFACMLCIVCDGKYYLEKTTFQGKRSAPIPTKYPSLEQGSATFSLHGRNLFRPRPIDSISWGGGLTGFIEK